ncbi:hypothetical protein BJX70DRAFT_395472 [Aspergillus crustosus]
MRATTFLPLLLSSLPIALAVKLNLTEAPWADGLPLRNEIIEVPYTNNSLLPKDQPCISLPFHTREVYLLPEGLSIPTICPFFT